MLGALVLAPAIPGAGADPILDFNTANGTQAGGKSYRASIAPLVDVGEKLRNIDIPNLFTVQSPRPDYWRVTALDEYSAEGGGQWTLNAAGEGKVKVGLPSTVPTNAVRQVYTISRLGERWLPAAYRPVSITLSDTLVVVSSWTLVTSESSVEGLTYTVGSVIGATADQITDAQQAATAAAMPKALEHYTELPADFPADITALAEQIVTKAGATTPFAKAKALRDFFRDPSFKYDTSIDLGDDANAIETFLRQRRGFCVQFASAYSVMARCGRAPDPARGGLHAGHEGRRPLHRRLPRRSRVAGGVAGRAGLDPPLRPHARHQHRARRRWQRDTGRAAGHPDRDPRNDAGHAAATRHHSLRYRSIDGHGCPERHRRHQPERSRDRHLDRAGDRSPDTAVGVDDRRVRQLRVDAGRARRGRHRAHRGRVRRDRHRC